MILWAWNNIVIFYFTVQLSTSALHVTHKHVFAIHLGIAVQTPLKKILKLKKPATFFMLSACPETKLLIILSCISINFQQGIYTYTYVSEFWQTSMIAYVPLYCCNLCCYWCSCELIYCCSFVRWWVHPPACFLSYVKRLMCAYGSTSLRLGSFGIST